MPARSSCASRVAATRRPRKELLHPSAALLARLLSARRSNSGGDVLALLRRWQDCFHAERLDPQFATPAFRMVKVFVFLLLDLIRRCLQRRALLAGRLLGGFSN